MATSDVPTGPFDACAHCGRRFERDVTYPVETRRTPGGHLELYSFCGPACQDAWHGDP